jgi:DNA polymerase-3 subunit delta
MKLNGTDAAAHIARPNPAVRATLIHGTDAMRVALKRQALTAAIVGPEGTAEMRVTRLSPADLREDRAALSDALRARGFFPGRRAVVFDDATHHNADAVADAVADLAADDAHLIVTAGPQKPASALLLAFASGPSAVAIAVYDDPPSAADVTRALAAAGLDHAAPDAREALMLNARAMPPGDFAQLIEKVTLFKLGDTAPLTGAEVAALAPPSPDAAVDEMMLIVSGGEPHRVGPTMSRLAGQGVTAVTLAIGAARHFRALHALAVDPRGRVFGPNRDVIGRHARAWGTLKAEQALRLLVDTDLVLRSASRAPQMAVVERALLRLAQLARR